MHSSFKNTPKQLKFLLSLFSLLLIYCSIDLLARRNSQAKRFSIGGEHSSYKVRKKEKVVLHTFLEDLHLQASNNLKFHLQGSPTIQRGVMASPSSKAYNKKQRLLTTSSKHKVQKFCNNNSCNNSC